MFSSSVQLIDPDGRLVIVKIREGDEDLFLASVYAPCDPQNQCCFIQNLCTVIVSNTNTSKVIIVGNSIIQVPYGIPYGPKGNLSLLNGKARFYIYAP